MKKQVKSKRTFEEVLGCNLNTVLHDDEDLTLEAKKDRKYTYTIIFCNKCKVYHLQVVGE